jgi:hypothetical protein
MRIISPAIKRTWRRRERYLKMSVRYWHLRLDKRFNYDRVVIDLRRGNAKIGLSGWSKTGEMVNRAMSMRLIAQRGGY